MKIQTQSGHTVHLEPMSEQEVVALDLDRVAGLSDFAGYTSFYSVRNWNEVGVVFFYVAKHKNRQVHVWYGHSKRMWSSFDHTFKKAINRAQKDGWLYA